MPKKKKGRASRHQDNVQQQPATIHLPSVETPAGPQSSMYVRRSTLKFDDEEKKEETVMMWDDDLALADVFTSEVIPYGIKQSHWEPDNVHFKQLFNQKDLLNGKVDAWKNLAEEAKRLKKHKEITANDKTEDESVNIATETNVEIDSVAINTTTNVANREDKIPHDDSISDISCSCTDFKHSDGVQCCGIQTGLPLPCFTVVVIFGLLIFPVTFLIAFVAFLICFPVVKFVKTKRKSYKSKASQSSLQGSP